MKLARSRRRCSRIDRTVLAVAQLVTDDGWSAFDAADTLRRQGHNETALTLARARIVAAVIERPGVYGDRAIATLDAALARSPAGHR